MRGWGSDTNLHGDGVYWRTNKQKPPEAVSKKQSVKQTLALRTFAVFYLSSGTVIAC